MCDLLYKLQFVVADAGVTNIFLCQQKLLSDLCNNLVNEWRKSRKRIIKRFLIVVR